MKYSEYILLNHYPEINLAWLRVDDIYFFNETEATESYAGYSVSAPVCSTSDDATPTDAASASDATATDAVSTDVASSGTEGEGVVTITLSVDDIVGEAIYYDLVNDTTGEVLATNKLYQGRFDLEKSDGASYTLTAYAISRGVRSEKVTYNF